MTVPARLEGSLLIRFGEGERELPGPDGTSSREPGRRPANPCRHGGLDGRLRSGVGERS